jgi:hypothetical protein
MIFDKVKEDRIAKSKFVRQGLELAFLIFVAFGAI